MRRLFEFDEKRRRVHSKSGNAKLQPQPDNAADFRADLRIRDVQVRLKAIETVEIMLAGDPVECPGGFLNTWEHHALIRVFRLVLAPDIKIPVIRLGVATAA